MLAIRYALMYPDDVDQLALVDPIGLEDWKAKGVPWQSVDAWYRRELHTAAESIRARSAWLETQLSTDGRRYAGVAFPVRLKPL